MTATLHTNPLGQRVLTIFDDDCGRMSVKPARNETDRLRFRCENTNGWASTYLDSEDEAELLRYLSKRATDRHQALRQQILDRGRWAAPREEFDDA